MIRLSTLQSQLNTRKYSIRLRLNKTVNKLYYFQETIGIYIYEVISNDEVSQIVQN